MLCETLKLSIRTITRNALRSILTVLGVVIGVGAVIAMVTLGEGTTAQVTSEVAKLGTNILMVRPGQAGFGPASASRQPATFTSKDVEAIENQVQGVVTAAPIASRNLTAIYGNLNHAMSVTGTDNRYLTARDWTVADGPRVHRRRDRRRRRRRASSARRCARRCSAPAIRSARSIRAPADLVPGDRRPRKEGRVRLRQRSGRRRSWCRSRCSSAGSPATRT